MQELKRTLLYSWHVEHGANMAPFGRYEMPLWYQAGAKAEHLAVITAAGLFDTSHMAVLTVGGAGARGLLQHCFSKDLERCIGAGRNPLVAGRCVYGVFLNSDGTVLDDAIVYQLGDTDYMIVVNAAMGAPVAERLGQYNGDFQATVTDLTDRVGKMDIQGPLAARIVQKLVADPDKLFTGLVYFSFKGGFAGVPGSDSVTLGDSTPLMVSRTGYTGEFGFELFIDRDHFVALWEEVMAIGEEYGALPCGLAARDSLRVGAGLPLSHQDIGPYPFVANPWLFALPWNEEGNGFTKEFVGDRGVVEPAEVEHTLPFAGYDPRKIVVSDTTFVTDLDGNRIGKILTCATDMAIDRVDGVILSIVSPEEEGRPADFTAKGLSCGFVLLQKDVAPGTEVILTDGKRKKITVEIRADIRPHRTARRPMKEML